MSATLSAWSLAARAGDILPRWTETMISIVAASKTVPWPMAWDSSGFIISSDLRPAHRTDHAAQHDAVLLELAGEARGCWKHLDLVDGVKLDNGDPTVTAGDPGVLVFMK